MKKDNREIETADFLWEIGGQSLQDYQSRLEQQADNLRKVDSRYNRDASGPEPLFDGQSGSLNTQKQGIGQAQPNYSRNQTPYEESVQNTGKYTRGYYDGYADALEEINERLEAEEEDEYGFGRLYGGRSTRKDRNGRKKKKQVIYEYDDDDYEETRIYRKKKKHRHHPFLWMLFFLIVLILAGAGFLVSHLLSRVNHINPVADTVADDHAASMGVSLASGRNVKNILLIGSDKRGSQEERQRSDSMILCSINSNTGEIILTSLMRDMYVPIPNYGYDKLNAAYAYGDVELLDETVQEDFGIDINGNILVDFDSFIQTLTSVGNLDIELTQEEADYLNSGGWEDQGDGGGNDGSWNLQAGVNSLTPAQSLAYCRIRYIGNSDWERTERQRRVVMAALAKFKHSNPLTQYRVLSGVMSNITTDMTNTTLISSMFRLLLAGTGNMQTYLIPAEGAYYADNVDGMDVLVPDLDQNSAYLKEWVYG